MYSAKVHDQHQNQIKFNIINKKKKQEIILADYQTP